MRFDDIAASFLEGIVPVPELLIDCDLDLSAFSQKD
jgi:hypothetical protein